MKYGQSNGPLLLVHGGAGAQDPRGEAVIKATEDIVVIAKRVYESLGKGTRPLDVVGEALRAMEDNPRFNAGIGASLQEDGQARVTAALMDGERQSFSAVLSLPNIQNPSILAAHLQNSDSRVLALPGGELLARRLGLPVADLVTPARRQRWFDRVLERDQAKGAKGYDTVGCVAWNGKSLASGTSTGGRGLETPGRISDSGTVAGNYCTAFFGCSATGTGEEIVDDGLCVRLETRVRDGMSLLDAAKKTLSEAEERGRQYGWIACDAKGNWVVVNTTPAMTFAVVGEKGILARSAGN